MTRPELKLESLESEKIGSLESDFGFLQVHTGCLIFSFKKTWYIDIAEFSKTIFILKVVHG